MTYLFTWIVIRIAPRLGLLDEPRDRHEHGAATPTSGGMALFLGFHIGCAVIFLYPWSKFAGSLDAEWWFSVLGCSSLLLAIGVMDDRWGIRPLVKLIGQVGVAVLAWSVGLRMGNLAGWELPVWVDLVLTTACYVGVVNAFNLVDGMDGLATGLASIAGVGLIGFFLFLRQPSNTLVMLSLVGASLAFLRYNFQPAKIFLGDAGSMFVGFVFTAVALSSNIKTTALASLGVPLLAVGVPVLDTLLAVWRRSLRGGSVASPEIMQGDLDHIHHRLANAGFSQRRVAMALYTMNLIFVVTGLALAMFNSYRLSIFLVAFVAGTYVMVRHIARIELWESGQAIVAGLRRPPSRVLGVVGYPITDTMAMVFALGIAASVLAVRREGVQVKPVWITHIPVMVGVPFISLVMGGAYRRVWSRARVSEYVWTAALFTGGVLVAAAITLCDVPRSAIDEIVIIFVYLGLAVPMVVGSRAFPRVVQDMLSWQRRKGVREDSHRVLCYGAGYAYTLFVRMQSFEVGETPVSRRIVGLIDDDTNLHGRIVHGYKVLGGGDSMLRLVDELGVDEILVTTPLDTPARKKVEDVAGKCDVKVFEWHMKLDEWDVAGPRGVLPSL
jgi:UDP-N-acetylmuramyl pentapeptide phosphotransferase/UDP-N-acetylglucosamine-1-phosphate transferase